VPDDELRARGVNESEIRALRNRTDRTLDEDVFENATGIENGTDDLLVDDPTDDWWENSTYNQSSFDDSGDWSTTNLTDDEWNESMEWNESTDWNESDDESTDWNESTEEYDGWNNTSAFDDSVDWQDRRGDSTSFRRSGSIASARWTERVAGLLVASPAFVADPERPA
jgi:hypothetical protein